MKEKLESNYLLKTNQDDSDYESEDAHYKPVRCIGQGAHSTARLFATEDQTKKVVVLSSPLSPRFKLEYQRAVRFFNTHYPGTSAKLFEFTDKQQRRLVTPFIAGQTYRMLRPRLIESGQYRDSVFQITLLRSFIAELQSLHAKGLIHLDVKADNVIFDAATGKTHLIDGDLVVLQSEKLPASFCVPVDQYEPFKRACHHVAPECWSTPDSQYSAQPSPSMDIYSMGVLFLGYMFNQALDSDVRRLLHDCYASNPLLRPTLAQLDASLSQLQIKRNYKGFQQHIDLLTQDDSHVLHDMIRFVADRFLLVRTIKLGGYCSHARQQECSLDALSPLEQALFLELGGFILFDYVASNRFSELDFHAGAEWTVASAGHALWIKHDVRPNALGSVPTSKQYSWTFDKAAATASFVHLMRSHSMLATFEPDLDKPVETAIKLWRQLSKSADFVENASSSVLAEAASCAIA